jgi:uncharacterized protein (AIM24 family)
VPAERQRPRPDRSGHILPTDITPGQAYFVHRHGWLCGTPGVTPSIGLQQTFRGGLWGGDGFILQKLEGQGQVWLQSMPLPVLAHSLEPYLGRAGDPQAAEAGAVGGIIGNIMRGQ